MTMKVQIQSSIKGVEKIEIIFGLFIVRIRSCSTTKTFWKGGGGDINENNESTNEHKGNTNDQDHLSNFKSGGRRLQFPRPRPHYDPFLLKRRTETKLIKAQSTTNNVQPIETNFGFIHI